MQMLGFTIQPGDILPAVSLVHSSVRSQLPAFFGAEGQGVREGQGVHLGLSARSARAPWLELGSLRTDGVRA